METVGLSTATVILCRSMNEMLHTGFNTNKVLLIVMQKILILQLVTELNFKQFSPS